MYIAMRAHSIRKGQENVLINAAVAYIENTNTNTHLFNVLSILHLDNTFCKIKPNTVSKATRIPDIFEIPTKFVRERSSIGSINNSNVTAPNHAIIKCKTHFDNPKFLEIRILSSANITPKGLAEHLRDPSFELFDYVYLTTTTKLSILAINNGRYITITIQFFGTIQ